MRPIENGDNDALSAFLAANDRPPNAPACGLLGKVVGDVVAVMSIEVAPDALVVHDVVVASELRKKRIARFLFDEAAQLAKKLDRTAIVVSDPQGFDEFLRRVGFSSEDGWFVRRVG